MSTLVVPAYACNPVACLETPDAFRVWLETFDWWEPVGGVVWDADHPLCRFLSDALSTPVDLQQRVTLDGEMFDEIRINWRSDARYTVRNPETFTLPFWGSEFADGLECATSERVTARLALRVLEEVAR